MYNVNSANGFKLGEFGDLEDALTALHAWPQASFVSKDGRTIARR